MNKVIVSTKEMIPLLKNTYTIEETSKYFEHLLVNGFVFNEFTLVWTGFYIYKVKITDTDDKGHIFHIKRIWEMNDGTHKHNEIDFELHEYLDNIGTAMKKLKGRSVQSMMVNRDLMEETWAADVLPVIMFMMYVLHKSINREIVEIETTTKKYKPLEQRKYNPPKNKTYKLIDVVRKYERHINKNKRHITCDYWEVKGHFRHLKNGKTIYVKPYSKGKNKDGISKDRIYKLGGV